MYFDRKLPSEEKYSLEIQFLRNLLLLCKHGGRHQDGIWQVSPVHARIPYSVTSIKLMESFSEDLAAHIPELWSFGSKRAKKAYSSRKHTISKPSYIARLRNYCNEWRACQIESILSLFEREPFSGGLVFSIFHPSDILQRFRPGYVPCLISGVFLKVGQELHLNAFFRSQSIIEFGLYDLMFLRSLQKELVSRIKEKKPRAKIECGALNLSFSRAIVQRRLARRRIKDLSGELRHVYLNRSQIVDKWLDIAKSYCEEEDIDCGQPRELSIGEKINLALKPRLGDKRSELLRNVELSGQTKPKETPSQRGRTVLISSSALFGPLGPAAPSLPRRFY